MNYIAEKWQALLEDREPTFKLPPLPRQMSADELFDLYCADANLESNDLMQEICETCYSDNDSARVRVFRFMTEAWGPSDGPGDKRYHGTFEHGNRIFDFVITDGVSNGTVLEEWEEQIHLVGEGNESQSV